MTGKQMYLVKMITFICWFLCNKEKVKEEKEGKEEEKEGKRERLEVSVPNLLQRSLFFSSLYFD